MDLLQSSMSRPGEQFACIVRNRSGIDSGCIDMGVRVAAIQELLDCDQHDAVSAALCLAESVIGSVRDCNKNGLSHLLKRVVLSMGLDCEFKEL